MSVGKVGLVRRLDNNLRGDNCCLHGSGSSVTLGPRTSREEHKRTLALERGRSENKMERLFLMD